MSEILRVTGTMRPNFLILTPVCVALGASVAYLETGGLDVSELLLVVLGALLAHCSVNMLNEFEDYRSGLDEMTVRTPFSGGSGTLPANPSLLAATGWLGYATLAATGAIGVHFVLQHGWGLLPLGLLGLLIVFGYSIWITRHPMICLVAPGLGFGPLMVMGTAFVLSGEYSSTAALVSMSPFFLVSGLLLLNQFPDVEPDRQVGRRNLPIVHGRETAGLVYNVFLFASFVPLILGMAIGWLPWSAAAGLLPLLVAPVIAMNVSRHANDMDKLVPFMGMNVAVVLATPALAALGISLA